MYNGYPEMLRTNGLIIIRTYLNPEKSGRDDECAEVVMIDPDYTVSVQLEPTPAKTVTWYSAREMRADFDKTCEWHCGN